MKSHSMSSDYERRFLQERSGFWTSYLLWYLIRYYAFCSTGFQGCVWLLSTNLHQLHGEMIKSEGSEEDSHCQPQEPGRRCHAGFAPGIFILGESALAVWRRGAKPRTHAQGQHETDQACQWRWYSDNRENRWTSEHPLESSRLNTGTNPLGCDDHASDHEQHHDQ